MLPTLGIGMDRLGTMRRFALHIVLLFWSLGCGSDALSIDAPNIIDVTPQPAIISVGESVRIDFYPQTALPTSETPENRQLDPSPLVDLGMDVESWVFRDAFDFSASVAVSEQASTGIFEVEFPISNEYADFTIRFNLQVTR